MKQSDSEAIQATQLLAMLDAGLSWHQAVAEVGQLSDKLQSIAIMVEQQGFSARRVLRTLISFNRLQQQVASRVEIAQASPKATAKIAIWLPVVALLLTQLLGMNTLGVLFRTPIAFASVIVGVVLLVAGQIWSAKLLDKFQIAPDDSAVKLALLVGALDSGFSLRQAIDRVGIAPDAELLSIESLADRSGIAAAELVIALLETRQLWQQQQALSEAERLSVRLMLPLGLTVLPAFGLIAVVPLAISFLQ